MYIDMKKSSWQWRRAISLKDHYDNHFRILILGDSNTGKSSLFLRLRKKIPTQDKLKKISRFEMVYGTTTVMNLEGTVTNKVQFVNILK
jgi:GTPase SAR1 family protein